MASTNKVKVRLLKRASGDAVTGNPGDIRPVDPKTAKELIDGGFAIPFEPKKSKASAGKTKSKASAGK